MPAVEDFFGARLNIGPKSRAVLAKATTSVTSYRLLSQTVAAVEDSLLEQGHLENIQYVSVATVGSSKSTHSGPTSAASSSSRSKGSSASGGSIGSSSRNNRGGGDASAKAPTLNYGTLSTSNSSHNKL